MNELNSHRQFEPRTDLSDTEVNRICDVVRDCGFALHKFLGPGFREKVYRTPLELGTPVCLGSISHATRIARAVALKIASAM